MGARDITVVIADDHELVRQGIRMLLETDASIQVIGEARNGRAAIAMAKDQHPDVVLMDLSMPDMNGIDAIQHLHEEDASQKAIAFSMHVTKEFVSRALGAGAKGYVVKDCAVQELLSAIHTVAGGSVYLSPKISSVIAQDYYESRSVEPAGEPDSALSSRETGVLQLITEGNNTKEIAAALGVSIKTVESHRANLMKKLNCHTIAELIKYAIRVGIAEL